MLITCKCLNVSICVKGDSIQVIDNISLGLSVNEQNDSFFKEELGTVDLVRISKEQPGLVQTRNIGNWIVQCCLNCSMDTHAINREKGASFVLVSCKMVVDPAQVFTLKNSGLFSPVFRIIVNSTDETSLVETKLTAPHMPSSVQTALGALQQQLHESLQRVAQEVEERVRKFSDEQYAHLDEFRRRAHEDHRALAKLLFEKFEADDKPILGASPRTPPATLDGSEALSLPAPPEMGSPNELMNNIQSDRKSPSSPLKTVSSSDQLVSSHVDSAKSTERSVSTVMRRMARGSLDSEGLFPLEGMDRHVDGVSEDELEIDYVAPVTGVLSRSNRDNIDGDLESDDRRSNIRIARSLPVMVPGFGRRDRDRFHGNESRLEEQENIDGLPPEDPMYIAASIKALARSVYGDTPFGELPRPRFSSQI